MTTIEQITDITWDIKGIRFDRAHRGIVWFNRGIEVAFLGIPKCANSAVRVHLEIAAMKAELGLAKDVQVSHKKVAHLWFKMMRQQTEESNRRYSALSIVDIRDATQDLFFTVIREPIARLVSAYIEVIQDCEIYPGGRYKHDLMLKPDKIKFLDHLTDNYDDTTRFTIFLDKVEECGFFDMHCVPQIVYLTDENGVAFPNVQVFGLDNMSLLESYINIKIEKSNQSENPGLKQKLLEFVKNRPDIKHQIEVLYKYDSMLWQRYLIQQEKA